MVNLVGNFADLNARNRSLRQRIQRGKLHPKVKVASTKTTKKPPKRVVPEPCYDSDKSDFYKPSNIIAKILKEQDEEKKKHKSEGDENVENLSYYPSCWLSIGMISSESVQRVKNMCPAEKIYNSVYASMVDQGVIDSDNDPESEAWVDPRSVDTCEKCGKPHVDADEKNCKFVLMQCYAEINKRTFGCRKWHHIGCIGREEVPAEDAWWACQKCATELDLEGIRVDHTGLEFPPEDVDAGFDAAEAKKAAAKDHQPNKGDDEAEDIVDDEDMVDDDPTDKPEDDNDSKATTKVDGDSKDDDSDESYRVDNSDVDESYDGDTEDEDQTSSGRKKKRTGGKKRPAEVAQESPVAKKRKTKGGDSSPVKARVTGDKPKTPKQLFDVIVCKKLEACKPTMECLQHMSLPTRRSNKCISPDDSGDESDSIVEQQGWPWMIHCLSCYAQVKPNDDGGKN